MRAKTERLSIRRASKNIMVSPKVRSTLLITLVALTLIFGSLSAYEYIQVKQLKSQSITTSTTTVTLTPSTTFTVATSTITLTWEETSTITVTTPHILNESEIQFYYGGVLYECAYKRMEDFPEGSTVNFEGVTFYCMPHNRTTCEVYHIRISFSDGTSERLDLGWCGLQVMTTIAFTNHSKPKAGVFQAPGRYGSGGEYFDQPIAEGIYLLVSVKEF